MNEDVKQKLWGLLGLALLVGFILLVVWAIGVLRNDDDTHGGSGAASSTAATSAAATSAAATSAAATSAAATSAAATSAAASDNVGQDIRIVSGDYTLIYHTFLGMRFVSSQHNLDPITFDQLSKFKYNPSDSSLRHAQSNTYIVHHNSDFTASDSLSGTKKWGVLKMQHQAVMMSIYLSIWSGTLPWETSWRTPLRKAQKT